VLHCEEALQNILVLGHGKSSSTVEKLFNKYKEVILPCAADFILDPYKTLIK